MYVSAAVQLAVPARGRRKFEWKLLREQRAVTVLYAPVRNRIAARRRKTLELVHRVDYELSTAAWLGWLASKQTNACFTE